MKKITSLLFVLIILISSVSTSVSASGFTYELEEQYCSSLYMISKDTGEVIFSYNSDEEVAIASLTKIMTYIVAYENIPDIENTVVTVSAEVNTILAATNSSVSGVMVGEELTVLELLNLMMIPSGNDAALVLCMYYDELQGEYHEYQGTNDSGVDSRSNDMSYSPFVQLMNEKAEELGCYNTNFTNPHGLYHDDHYSTAENMATIARYASTLPYFSEITSSTTYTLEPTNVCSYSRTVYSSNKMFSQYSDEGMYYYKYADGMKTGSLTESGYCIAASATYNGYSYIVVALGSPYGGDNGAMLDARTLFRWAFTNISSQVITTKESLLGAVSVEYAWDTDTVKLVADQNLEALLPDSVASTSVVVTLDIPDSIEAPVSAGDIIGTATFTYAENVLGTVNVVAKNDVDKSAIMYIAVTTKDVIISPTFIIIMSSLVVIIILYLFISARYKKKKKMAERANRYRKS